MSDFFKALLLGVIEGLTEFIPVSSTGHLIVLGDLIDFHSANSQTFDIAIQLGAILAVAVYYRSFFIETFHPKNWFKHDMKCIIIACIPAFILGFFLHSVIKMYLFSPLTVAIGLLVGSVAMIVSEKWNHLRVNVTEISYISYRAAFMIGIFQCAALWPGVSRSGATIVGGLLSKLDHQTASKFSFIIAVPVMIAAVTFDLATSFQNLTAHDFQLIGVGLIVSFGVAIFSIAAFFKILNRLKLMPFAVYRIIIAFAILLFIV
ncbi:MAG: undecaprenyl-diphosphate phosphatase [Candidatus Margulisbacteria bacterium]|nr:undecaprenyl-diphosphate phosphatase [Candidatus Margulisiibacteriota bacterium]